MFQTCIIFFLLESLQYFQCMGKFQLFYIIYHFVMVINAKFQNYKKGPKDLWLIIRKHMTCVPYSMSEFIKKVFRDQQTNIQWSSPTL